jgi:ssDNA-binding Zn-finger/Zn-ribbon topoisomerase 1
VEMMNIDNLIDKLHFTICPICGTEMIQVKWVIGSKYHVCRNKCYESLVEYNDSTKTPHLFQVKIFEEHIGHVFVTYFEYLMVEMLDDVNKKVDYWKDNERYLAEIMMR